MTRKFVVIASMRRGAVTPAEPLDEFGQFQANRRAAIDEALEREVLRRRVTSGYQLERDPEMTFSEAMYLYGKHGNSRVGRMFAGGR